MSPPDPRGFVSRTPPPPRATDNAGELGRLAGDFGRMRREIAEMRAAIASGLANVNTRIDTYGKAADSMRPKFASINSEITNVGRRAIEAGKLAHRLVTEKRGFERLRRKILIAMVIGFVGAIGAGVGAIALRTCGAFEPAPHEVKP